MLSLQARLVRLIFAYRIKRIKKDAPSPAHARRLLSKGLSRIPVPTHRVLIRHINVDGIPVEIIRPRRGGNDTRAMMYIHGGGYVSGSPETHRGFAARLALALDCDVWVPAYRLAPEHPFPAGLHDVADVWNEFLHQQTGKTVILGGESAGGGLSLALCYLQRQRQLALPDQLYLLSAWLDIRMAGDSYIRNDPNEIISPSWVTEQGFARHYAGRHSRSHPLMSPILGDPTGLPPTYVQVSDREIFEDDSRTFVQQAQVAGVNVTLKIGRGLWHAWPLFAPYIPEANQAIRHFARWSKQQQADQAAHSQENTASQAALTKKSNLAL